MENQQCILLYYMCLYLCVTGIPTPLDLSVWEFLVLLQ